MARLETVLRDIGKHYKFATAQGFLYNKESELDKKSDKMGFLVLLFDKDAGFVTHTFVFKRKSWSHVEWGNFFGADDKYKGYEGGMKIITDQILPARNDNMGEEWGLIEVIGYAFNMADKMEKFH